MTLRPGSLAWLVAGDLRLNWRRTTDMIAGARGRPHVVLPVLAAAAAVLHLLAWPVVVLIAPVVHDQAASAALIGVVGSAFAWMVAQSLFGSTRALYDRGDLDLLLGSPLPPGRVIAAKAIAIAAGTCGSVAFLTLPVANAGAVVDRAAWLGVYPVLAGLAMIATALGLALAMTLFYAFGARRARLFANMTGAVIGGAFVLAAQLVAMLPSGLRQAVTDWVEHGAGIGDTAAGALLRLPIEALRGDGTAMVVLVVAGAGLLTAVVALLGERFAQASVAAAGAADDASARSDRPVRFRAGLGRALRRKEWRLISRDPNLFAQLGLQMIYTIPVAVVLLRSETVPAALVLAPTIVVIASQLAASLAWLTVSGEDAPELIATAPVAAAAVDRAKLGAIAWPVAAILALPMLALALLSWSSALIVALIATAASASTALLNLWHPMPGNRRGMLRRHAQSKLVGLVEHVLSILWAVAVLFATAGTAYAVVPLGLALAVLGACGLRQRVAGRRTAVADARLSAERA